MLPPKDLKQMCQDIELVRAPLNNILCLMPQAPKLLNSEPGLGLLRNQSGSQTAPFWEMRSGFKS